MCHPQVRSIHRLCLEDPDFNLVNWYKMQPVESNAQTYQSGAPPFGDQGPVINMQRPSSSVELGGMQVDRNKYPALQQNASQVKGNQRLLPKPIVIKVEINGHPTRALLDSGSLGDFVSTTLADQLGLKRRTLEMPVALQLAVQGSRSKVNSVMSARIKYQSINEECTFDIINLNNYDLILGTP
jgi:hypothetical protein